MRSGIRCSHFLFQLTDIRKLLWFFFYFFFFYYVIFVLYSTLHKLTQYVGSTLPRYNIKYWNVKRKKTILCTSYQPRKKGLRESNRRFMKVHHTLWWICRYFCTYFGIGCMLRRNLCSLGLTWNDQWWRAVETWLGTQ